MQIKEQNAISLNQAAKYFQIDGKKPHTSSLWRWCRVGLAGGKVKLRYRKFGRRIVTSIAACEQFSDELAAVEQDAYDREHPPVSPELRRSQSNQSKAAADAAAELASAGI